MGGRRGLRRGKQPSRGDSGCSPTPRLRFRLPWLGKFRSRMGQPRWGGTDLQLQEYVETSHVSCPPKVPPTGELPALRIQVRQSRERLEPLAK